MWVDHYDVQESDGSDDTVRDASTESKVLYGKDEAEDPGDEVVFSVQLTRLAGLTDCSLDIRRLKGNLRSYKFIYDTITQYAYLCLKYLRLQLMGCFDARFVDELTSAIKLSLPSLPVIASWV